MYDQFLKKIWNRDNSDTWFMIDIIISSISSNMEFELFELFNSTLRIIFQQIDFLSVMYFQIVRAIIVIIFETIDFQFNLNNKSKSFDYI